MLLVLVRITSTRLMSCWWSNSKTYPQNEPPRDKTNKMSVRPAKTQISLGIHPVWSESSLYAQWVAKNPSFLHADSKDSDQTGWMPRLIWVFAGRTVILLVLSWEAHIFSTTATCTWQNQQNECAPSEDTDQPGHPPSLIRVFAVRPVGS